MRPEHPIAAVTHPDPYPYYAELVRDRPMYRDEALGLWVASSAAAVSAVLTAPHLRVRPSGAPVPPALVGTPLGDYFGRLVRQTDGPAHPALKQTVAETLGTLPLPLVTQVAIECAQDLAPERSGDADELHTFQFQLSTWTLGVLLGISPEQLAPLGDLVERIVPGLAPTATPEAVSIAQRALSGLQELMSFIAQNSEDGGMIWDLMQVAGRTGVRDPHLLLANALGFLTQAYEATAGLIGNTMLALAERPALAAQARKDAGALMAIVREVVRYDSPVQNTRRFVAEPTEIAGAKLQPGDAILVVLAAANRDPAANAAPDTFDPARTQRTRFTFGLGPHACPGEDLACAIAAAGIAEVLRGGSELDALTHTRRYRPSGNGRILLLGAQ